MDNQLLVVQSKLDRYDSMLTSLSDSISEAVSNANQFYESIAGAQGLLQWLSDNLDGLNLGSELCGRTTPSWCDFSKVSFRNLSMCGLKCI
jgi:hypothetical protein